MIKYPKRLAYILIYRFFVHMLLFKRYLFFLLNRAKIKRKKKFFHITSQALGGK